MVYIMSGNRDGERAAQLRRRLQHRQKEEHPGVHRRRGRDADRSEYLSAARLHVRGLQRRQVPARAAVRRADPGPQRPAAGRMGVERAASRAWPHDEDRQGRDGRAARRRRDVGAARPQERRRDVDAVDADHRRPRHQDRRRHGRRAPAERPGQSQSRDSRSIGIPRSWASRARKSRIFSGPPSLASRWAVAEAEVAAAAAAARPTRPASRSPPT